VRRIGGIERARQSGGGEAIEGDRLRPQPARCQPPPPEALVKEEWQNHRRDTSAQGRRRGSGSAVVNDRRYPGEEPVVRGIADYEHVAVLAGAAGGVAAPAREDQRLPPAARQCLQRRIDNPFDAPAVHAAEPDADGWSGGEKLLLSILDPSREVAPNYINYLIETKDGQSVLGILASDTPSAITVRQAYAKETVIPREQIKRMSSQGKSLMPEGLETGLKAEDVADLIAFIESGK